MGSQVVQLTPEETRELLADLFLDANEDTLVQIFSVNRYEGGQHALRDAFIRLLKAYDDFFEPPACGR